MSIKFFFLALAEIEAGHPREKRGVGASLRILLGKSQTAQQENSQHSTKHNYDYPSHDLALVGFRLITADSHISLMEIPLQERPGS